MQSIRGQLVWVHLIIASFSIPFILMVAVSGGLYLAGVKGSTTTEQMGLTEGTALNIKSDTIEQDVRQLISTVDDDYDFEYIRAGSSTIQTRPTSRTYYQLSLVDETVTLVRHQPDLQKSLIELHKGHGPRAFKIYQQILALGFVFILISGVATGLLSKKYKRKTVLVLAIGSGVFFLLAFT